MSELPSSTRPTIYPSLRYADAPAAIEWLGRAFGFERHFVVDEPNGRVAHAELRLGDGFIMLGSDREDDLNYRTPGMRCGVTGSIYCYVDDPDAHFARAVEAGAEVVRAVAATDYGSREYTARDPEGHLWSFGTYRPGDATA